ncbi:MAG: polysaccharide pyruvyl transferase family protein [Thiobacillus sp.]
MKKIRVGVFESLLILAAKHRLPWLARNRILIVPPATDGSLGDQALLSGLSELVAEKSGGKLVQLILPGWHPIKYSQATPEAVTLDFNSRAQKIKLLFYIARCKHFGVVGADVMDGKYSPDLVEVMVSMCNKVFRAGIPTTIFGFSFSDTPNPRAVVALRQLDKGVQCFCRDPISLKRFVEFTGHSAELVADLAFHMQPALISQTANLANDWVIEKRKLGLSVVGLNANVLTALGNTEDLFKSYAREITFLFEQNNLLAFLMLPHDLRKGQSDFDSLARILDEIPEKYHDKIHLLAPPFDSWDVKSLASKVDVVLTGRMHLAIAALSQCTPVIGITYQGKYEGLFHYFEMEHMVITPTQVGSPGLLADKIMSTLNCKNELKNRIFNSLQKVKTLSCTNVDQL